VELLARRSHDAERKVRPVVVRLERKRESPVSTALPFNGKSGRLAHFEAGTRRSVSWQPTNLPVSLLLAAKTTGAKDRLRINQDQGGMQMPQKSTLSLLVVGAVLALGTAPVAAQKQTLRMAYWAGPSHHMVLTLEGWAKMISDASAGNLTIEVDKAGLAKPSGQYDLVKNGVRDMVWHVTAYTPGRFTMLEANALPFICPNAEACSGATWKWYQKHGLDKKEFTDTKLLTVFVHGPGNVHTTKPAKTLEQIKGFKVRAGGAGVPISKALGMSAVAMPATAAHEALQRGTVEGVLFPWEAMNSFRLNDLVKHHLEIPGGMYAATFVIVINPASFNKLSDANKAALMKASGEAGSAYFGKKWDEADGKAKADAKKMGHDISTLAPDQLKIWKEKLQFVEEDWLKQAKEKGFDGKKLLDDLKATIKASSS
jgi:TRAP-type C4-dicarboxylate transport system substrate-binding protein